VHFLLHCRTRRRCSRSSFSYVLHTCTCPLPGSGSGSDDVAMVTAGGFVYMDGLASAQPNVTDVFAAISTSLKVSQVKVKMLTRCTDDLT
jgi:hypothetical protein